MKAYDPRVLRKPFKHPVWGRALLLLLLLVYPVVGPAILVWQKRQELIDEGTELLRAIFLPREK